VVYVGRTLWQYCHMLRHDGMDYGEYLDQLTYLLFLKMADERSLDLPPGAGWSQLVSVSDDRLLLRYTDMLRSLKASGGFVGDIYSAPASAFSRAESLRRVIELLDQVSWASLPMDVQAEAFESLLERAAAEGKKGTGQYFTPRPLIESIVRCIQPGAAVGDRLVSDPAAGTAGLLVAAHAGPRFMLTLGA
jgi:type I restriction enzyme M protein